MRPDLILSFLHYSCVIEVKYFEIIFFSHLIKVAQIAATRIGHFWVCPMLQHPISVPDYHPCSPTGCTWVSLGGEGGAFCTLSRELPSEQGFVPLGKRAVNGVPISAGRAEITQWLDATSTWVMRVCHVARCDAEAWAAGTGCSTPVLPWSNSGLLGRVGYASQSVMLTCLYIL